MLIHVPEGGNHVVDTPLSQVSLSATLADLCGVKQIAPNDGRSFASLMGNSGKHYSPLPVFAEYALNTLRAKYMMRDGNWKYTFWVNDREELYNLKADPEELHNLAAEDRFAQEKQELKSKLLHWYTPPEIASGQQLR